MIRNGTKNQPERFFGNFLAFNLRQGFPAVSVITPGILSSGNLLDVMKVNRKTRSGESREVLLKEYFITASLIALLKRAGQEAARMNPRLKPAMHPLRIRN